MGSGALVKSKQGNWPSDFDFGMRYLHLDDLFQHEAPVEYENHEGNLVKLAKSKAAGKLEFYVDGTMQREISGLKYDPNTGRLADQDNSPLGATVDSKGIVPLNHRHRVMYLLTWLAKQHGVPGLPEDAEEPLAFALLLFERPVTCPLGSLLIGSKLDFDIHSPNCRMAFFGKFLVPIDPKELQQIKVMKMKQKVGFLDRLDKQDKSLIVCKDMFKADTDMSLFYGLKVVHESSGVEGIMDGAFGKAGKFKVRFPHELEVRSDAKGNVRGHERIALHFKKFDFEASTKRFIQD
jgi:hypothetical protein